MPRVANEGIGWDELIAKFQATEVDLVVLEPTSGCERGLVSSAESLPEMPTFASVT